MIFSTVQMDKYDPGRAKGDQEIWDSDQNLGIQPETFYFLKGSEAQSKQMQLKQKLFIQ